MKTMKVYKVTFGAFEDGEDYINLDCKTVIAQAVDDAVACAVEKLTKKEQKTYYPQGVEMITELD